MSARHTTQLALRRIAAILAAKGGTVADITVGDCLELLQIAGDLLRSGGATSPYFYQLLHAAGDLRRRRPADGPGVQDARASSAVEQLIDRYGIACRPVRDLLVDYLRERQPGVDYATLHEPVLRPGPAVLAGPGDSTIPGIGSLRLAPERRPRRGSSGSPPRRSGPPAPAGRSPRSTAPRHRRHRTPWPRSGPSTSTSPSGRPTTRPGGDRGPCPARSAPTRCPAQEGTLPPQVPDGPADPGTAARPARPGRRRRRRTRQAAAERLHAAAGHRARRAVHRRRADAAPAGHDPRHQRAGSGPKTPAPASAAT